MGHVADVCRPASHDDSGSYGGDDSEVKMTRQATGTLRRPPRGNKTQGGTSSQEAARRFAASSRTTSRSRHAPRRPGELRKVQPRRPERPSQTIILGLRREQARPRREEEPAEAPF
jgi:hypothetical protein